LALYKKKIRTKDLGLLCRFNFFLAYMLYAFLKQKILSVQKHIFTEEDQRNKEKTHTFIPLLLLQL